MKGELLKALQSHKVRLLPSFSFAILNSYYLPVVPTVSLISRYYIQIPGRSKEMDMEGAAPYI